MALWCSMLNFARRERITIIKGKLCREFYCQGKGAEMMVGKYFEDGTQTSRNLDYCGMFGWRFTEPGRRYSRYYRTFTAELDPWGNWTPSLCNFDSRKLTEADKETVTKVYPEFKWILNKTDFGSAHLFKMIKCWKKDPKLCETLCSMGCQWLALNGSFYTARDRWDIVKWLSKNLDRKGENLADIRLNMKGYDWNDIHNWRSSVWRYNYVNIDEWLYLVDKNLGISHYIDYIAMAKKAGHDVKDPYWHYPKDLKRAHDKVMKECANIDRLKKEAELKKQQDEYTAKIKKYIGKELELDGLKVFVQGDLTKWQNHADKLHQCIVANNYAGKVIKGECVLVFITKKNKPYATAELKPTGKKFVIGQFYGDEHKSNYHAKEDAKNALNEWAKEFKIKIAA